MSEEEFVFIPTAMPTCGCACYKNGCIHQTAVEWSIAIDSIGTAKRIEVIKEIRSLTQCTLQEAIEIVDKKKPIREDLNKWELQEYRHQIEKIGAVVKIAETMWDYVY